MIPLNFTRSCSKARVNHTLTPGRSFIVFQKYRDALHGPPTTTHTIGPHERSLRSVPSCVPGLHDPVEYGLILDMQDTNTETPGGRRHEPPGHPRTLEC